MVFLAINKITGASSALKFNFPAKSTDKEQKQILRETRITKSLNSNPYIVKVFATFEDFYSPAEVEAILPADGARSVMVNSELYRHTSKNTPIRIVCIQMELCGENLRQWCTQNKAKYNNTFVQRDQVEIVSNIVSGLQFLHKNGVMHRDLKPENVMFSKKGFKLPAKIGDFGLCRKIEPEGSETSSLTSFMGTKAYMAPEILTGDKNYSYQADIYSAGLLIWEVLQFVKYAQFEKLLIDGDVELVEVHPLGGEVLRRFIISMTKRRVAERQQNLEPVIKYFKTLETQLAHSIVKVGSASQLKSTLKRATRGISILLCDEVYAGPFHVVANNITITGESMDKTVIQCKDGHFITFSEDAEQCCISNIGIASGQTQYSLEVRGNRNKVDNIAFKSKRGLLLTGNDNVVSNISFSNGMQGLRVHGRRNKIDGIKIKNMSQYGICIESAKSTNNVLTNITIIDTEHAILINGSENRLSKIALIKTNTAQGYRGVQLFYPGENNVINDISCRGYSTERNDWGLIIGAESTTVNNSDCGPVLIQEAYSNINKTDCGQKVLVGANGVLARFEGCSGDQLAMNGPDVEVVDCNFKSYVGLEKITNGEDIEQS